MRGVLVPLGEILGSPMGLKVPQACRVSLPQLGPPAFQLLPLTSVPSKLSQVAGCSHPSWEQHRQLRETQSRLRACSIQFPIRTARLSQMAPWCQGGEGLLQGLSRRGAQKRPVQGYWRVERGDRGSDRGCFTVNAERMKPCFLH